MRHVVCALAVLLVATGLAEAQAGVGPVDPTTKLPVAGSVVTVSLLRNNANVTSTWLPTPGTSVSVVVDGLANATVSLVFVAASAPNPPKNGVLTTSAYPGVCTNTGTDTGPDFTLSGTTLTANDCGGMAVLRVDPGGLMFVVPADSDFDGLPDLWEAPYCPTATPTCLDPATDVDGGPVTTAACCDGFATFDEYRGFMVNGVHTRTNPLVKDLLVRLATGHCGGGDSLLRGGTKTYPTDEAPLLANLGTLISGSQVHGLGPVTEWVDNLTSLTLVNGTPTFTYTTAGPATDRQVNRNAVYPLVDTFTGGTIQKGLRISECLDTSAASPLGSAGLGSPNGPDNAILYTKRIVNHVNALIDAGAGRRLRHLAFESGAWVAKFSSAGAPTAADRDVVISRALQFYLAMELGHSVRLTPTTEGGSRTSYGYHHAPGSGSNLDQTITAKIDKLTSGFNSFYIPASYNSADQSAFRLRQ